jgi:sulfite reductase alpha subunit-like flavoprotein
MIGPGSGIAPMRALLQERQYRITAAKINPKDSENILFFGCKSKKLDFLYQDEFEGALSQGTLSAFWVAFSRDQEKKVYVQDLIADPEIGMRLARVLMEKNGYIYVCGGSGIGAGIMNVLTDVIAKYKGTFLIYTVLFSIFSCQEKNYVFFHCFFPLFSRACMYLCLYDIYIIICVGIDNEEAGKIIKTMQKEKRYVQELWST